MAANRRANGSPENPVRSVRVDNPTWAKAVRRAKGEGTTMSAVLLLFVKGYADGMLNAPRTTVVYSAPAPPAKAVAVTDQV